MTFLNHLAVILIIAYQKTLSPDHGWLKYRHPYGFCHFYPSCSEYAKQAFRQKIFLVPWFYLSLELANAILGLNQKFIN